VKVDYGAKNRHCSKPIWAKTSRNPSAPLPQARYQGGATEKGSCHLTERYRDGINMVEGDAAISLEEKTLRGKRKKKEKKREPGSAACQIEKFGGGTIEKSEPPLQTRSAGAAKSAPKSNININGIHFSGSAFLALLFFAIFRRSPLGVQAHVGETSSAFAMGLNRRYEPILSLFIIRRYPGVGNSACPPGTAGLGFRMFYHS